MFRILSALAAACLLLTLAPTARAQTWLKAESEHFVAYSDGGERALRDFVVKLERFDQILRLRFGIPPERPTLRKLPIYLVARRDGLSEVAPSIGRSVAGFYITGAEEDIFAVAMRNGGEETILHEYAHHFFFQHLNAPYPGWLTEGLAEYVMTVDIRDDEFVLGEANVARASWLNNSAWLPLDALLSKRFGQIEGRHQATYYPVAWLLTHWFFSTPERSRQLDAYLRLVASGVGPTEALTQATGLTVTQLTQTLNAYSRSTIYSATYPITYKPIEVTITRMPESARDMILLGQRIKLPLPDDMRGEALTEVRRAAARWPDDPFALLILGHAELHMGDAEVGEATLLRVLELQPDNDEALRYLATGRMREAEEAEDPDLKRSLLGQARSYLARAYAIDPEDYFTLLLIAQTREGQPGYPNDNDLLTWESAFDGAPQLPTVRLGYGRALIASGRAPEALAILTPLANSPHGGAAADQARALIAEVRGEAPPPPEEAPAEEVDQAG